MSDKTKTFSTRIKSKRDTSANWESANPVLLNGEKIIVDTAAGEVREKIGDGVKTYSQLPFTDEKIRGLITEKADEVELERFKYYGDKDIIPSDASYFTVNSTGETITGLTNVGKAQTELVIPYEINGKKITTLCSGSDGISRPPVSILDGNRTITKVVIPKSVTTLGGAAFYGCSSLASINVPNSVTSIGTYAFSGCSSLTKIEIPNSVTSIGNLVFSPNLTVYCEQGSCADTVAKNENVSVVYTTINENDLINKDDLSNKVDKLDGDNCITIGSDVGSIIGLHIKKTEIYEDREERFKLSEDGLVINYHAGSHPPNTADVIVNRNVESAEGTYSVMSHKLTEKADEVELERLKYYGDKDIIPAPESYFTVSGNTLTGLTDTGKMNLSSDVVIPYKINGTLITSIGTGAFKNYEYLIDSITLPSSITAIEAEAFYGCTFGSIEIPSSVLSIGDSAFANCSALTSVTILNHNNILLDYSNIFSGCNSTLKIYCEQGSPAETFAKNNNIPVVYLSVKGKVTTITVPTTGWTTATDSTGETYFTINITNSALTSTGYPLCDVVLPDDIAAARLQDEAYKCIGKITINDGSVTLCCFDEIPSVSFTMRIQIMYL